MWGLFKSRKYKLPVFPSDSAPLFKRLCRTLDESGIRLLRSELDKTFGELMVLSRRLPHLNIKQIKRLYENSVFLLDQYEHLSKRHQALAVGAVRYFMSMDDTLSALYFSTGFDDDCHVMNYVMEELGIKDRFIVTEGTIWK